jgi:nicotinamidase-related amidase
MEKIAFFGIDFQNDFCKKDGSLFVQGADGDILKITAATANRITGTISVLEISF